MPVPSNHHPHRIGDVAPLRIDRDAAPCPGWSPAIVLGIAAAAVVAYRTPEHGTQPAPGFSRSRIVLAFIAEFTALAFVGGLGGYVLALAFHGISIGTINLSSFGEVASEFRITPLLLAGGIAFAALIGAAGGLLPALRAARIPVARAVREI